MFSLTLESIFLLLIHQNKKQKQNEKSKKHDHSTNLHKT
jgi:hypothetical protein